MSLQESRTVYDNLRPHLDAADLIRRLGIKETRTIGSESYCVPLCHESQSGESLQINLHTGRWNCKACQSAGVYGDLIQLVEYVQTGGAAPSRGKGQLESPTHRAAMEWLCEQFGIPYNVDRIGGDPGLDVVHLFAMAAHEHLKSSPKVLEWIQDKWGFDLETVEAYGLGYMPSPILPAIAAEAVSFQSRAAFRESGLGWHPQGGGWKTRFEGRVTFPYLEHGRAVYLIGRATPWTPKLESGAEPPKYHKLSVHSEKRPHISNRITNDHLYNEPIMASTSCVVIAEGVADAVALSALGVPLVSPVTVSFNAVDLERFVSKAHENKINRVEILFDNELSGSGGWAARRLGLSLVRNGIAASILTLPLGDEQLAARGEVLRAMGSELFEELERLDPTKRKALVLEHFPDSAQRLWLVEQINKTKIDAAEWVAKTGAGAPGKFDAIRRAGRDVIELEIEDAQAKAEGETDPLERLDFFAEAIQLAAHISEAISRSAYATNISQAAGKGITKADVAKRIADFRRDRVLPQKKKKEDESKISAPESSLSLILLPPEPLHVQPEAPAAPKKAEPGAPPPAPELPRPAQQSEHERYAPVRNSVTRGVAAKLPEEQIGEHVAQTITRSMGWTPFRTADELYLVRGSVRIPTGLGNPTPAFSNLLWLVGGLTVKKSSHRSYVAATVYFLERDARKVADVSWSFVDRDGSVFFPTGDPVGTLLRIEPGKVTKTRMSEARVPAVAGPDFAAIEYDAEARGVERVLQLLRWTSLSAGDRLILVYWVACLPVLRRIGTIPIVRIEGGRGSGKTRTLEAIGALVNGRKSGSVPTAAALVSRMAAEMLTFDDNRETNDVSPAFLGTLLQATHLGAREKRKANSDTGTVVERITGAILMNGIEPIHDGRSELASRILTLRCRREFRATDSPAASEPVVAAFKAARNAFWSEAAQVAARALELDQEHGERLGSRIETTFGETGIGRLSAYIRVMYLAWVAGRPEAAQAAALADIAPEWIEALSATSAVSLRSLLAEELVVSALRYVFAYGERVAKPRPGDPGTLSAWGDAYVFDVSTREAFLGPLSGSRLARLAREAGSELNAPEAITRRLRAGQLEARVMDGIGLLQAEGIETLIEPNRDGSSRFTFRRAPKNSTVWNDGTGVPPAGF